MATDIKKFKLAPLFMLISCCCLLFASGCTRYSRQVNTIYHPTATVRGGSGDVYIVIPENRQTSAAGIKWVLGKVKDDDNNNIDEVYSPRSPAEIIQEAFGQELKSAGYTVTPVTIRPAGAGRVIELTKTVIELEQVTDLADLKATCRVVVGMEVFRNGLQVKRLQYESNTARTDIRGRDMLARNVLEDALRSVMQKAMPDLHNLLRQ